MHPLDNLKMDTGIGVLVFVSFGIFISLIGIMIIGYGNYPYSGAIALGIGLSFGGFAVYMVTEYKSKKDAIMNEINTQKPSSSNATIDQYTIVG
jgi:hypothetical protein